MNKKNIYLAGTNIYLNKSGNTVYYNIFDKRGYIVGHKVEQKFRLFYYRYFIVIALLVLLGDYFKTFENTLLIGIVAIFIIEIYFRKVFLKKLKYINDFKKERKVSKVDIIIKSQEKEKIIMRICAYIALSILIIINAIQQNYNLIFMILSIIIALYALYSAIINSVAVSRMNSK